MIGKQLLLQEKWRSKPRVLLSPVFVEKYSFSSRHIALKVRTVLRKLKKKHFAFGDDAIGSVIFEQKKWRFKPRVLLSFYGRVCSARDLLNVMTAANFMITHQVSHFHFQTDFLVFRWPYFITFLTGNELMLFTRTLFNLYMFNIFLFSVEGNKSVIRNLRQYVLFRNFSAL